jgi:hypothetical protein
MSFRLKSGAGWPTDAALAIAAVPIRVEAIKDARRECFMAFLTERFDQNWSGNSASGTSVY